MTSESQQRIGNRPVRDAWIRGDQEVTNYEFIRKQDVVGREFGSHSWVQRMFPMKSDENKLNQAVSEEDIEAIKKKWGEKLREMFSKNINGYVRSLQSDRSMIDPGNGVFNHNQQRMTRILQSSLDFGFPELTLQFWEDLKHVYAQHRIFVPKVSYYKYWKPIIEQAMRQSSGDDDAH